MTGLSKDLKGLKNTVTKWNHGPQLDKKKPTKQKIQPVAMQGPWMS